MQRLARLAERVRSRTSYRVRGADLAQRDAEIDRIFGLMNRSLAHIPDFSPWERSTVTELLAPFRQIADPELVLFAETPAGEAVGWLPGIPNMNETLIGVNGLRYPWNYLQLLLRVRRRPECLAVKSVLVPPEYWDIGVAVLPMDELARRAAAKGYR